MEENSFKLEVKPTDLATVVKVLAKMDIQYDSTLESTGYTVISMKLSDKQSTDLSAALTRYNIRTAATQLGTTAVNTVINATEYIAKDIAVPVAKLGLKLGASASRIAIESAVIAGASAFNVVTEQSGATLSAVKASEEVKVAKDNMKSGLSKIKSCWKIGGLKLTRTL